MAAVPVIVERLDAQAVPGAEKSTGVLVPDGEREHAAEVRDAVRAVLLIGVQDGFGVAMGCVAMAGGFQARAEIGVVEDLSVVDNPETAVFVGHRLMAGGDVDNAEAAMAQRRTGIVVKAVVVGSAMRDSGGHPPDNGARIRNWHCAGESGDPAHRPRSCARQGL